uniref:Uncharacterized protein n=1 Tax=Quercus lobata TaxID=97700 RepID=A0A7N2LH04_QUELO
MPSSLMRPFVLLPFSMKRLFGRIGVRSTTGDDHAEQSPIDPTGTVADIGDDGVHAHSTAADPTVPPPLSIRAMMETIMTTQAAHGQLLDGLIAEVAALRADFSESSSAFPPPPPSDS